MDLMLADRRDRVTAKLPDDVQALLVTSPVNVRYLTGFTGSNGQLLLTSDPVFFTDGRYLEQSAEQVPDLPREIYTGTIKFTDVIAKALADRGITRIGVEATHMTIASRDKLGGELSGIELVPTEGLVEKVRRVKDADEIASIRTAQAIAEEALVSSLKAFGGGTELDLALAIELAMRRTGAEAPSFDTIVATGPHSALPHASPRREPVDLDGILLIDMGAKAGGYCSDMTRTFLGPRAPGEMRKVFDAVVAALDAGCAAVKPGVRCADVDRAAREVLDQAGYGDAFLHSTGHGVGLEIHEGPSLSTLSEDVLEPGMIVTIEPGVYLSGIGGVRVEDFLVVTEEGAENLTTLPRGSEFPRGRGVSPQED
jgi:Xaa-Pro aminopeptidase